MKGRDNRITFHLLLGSHHFLIFSFPKVDLFHIKIKNEHQQQKIYRSINDATNKLLFE